MIIKTRKQNPFLTPQALALQTAAILGFVFMASTSLKSWFNRDYVETCSKRYPKSVKMGLRNGAALISASDLQARAAGRDIGIMENLAVTDLGTSAPMREGFAVSLKAGSAQPHNPAATGGGISMPWQPRALGDGVKAACLSFAIKLPADFDFGTGGTLPGFFGASPREGADVSEQFTTHGTWGQNGGVMQHTALSTTKNWMTDFQPESPTTVLPRGRWVAVEQELRLNAPGKKDGLARLWVDGRLVADIPWAELRYSADGVIQGIMMDVYFGGQVVAGTWSEGRAAKDEQVLMTPFEVRWN